MIMNGLSFTGIAIVLSYVGISATVIILGCQYDNLKHHPFQRLVYWLFMLIPFFNLFALILFDDLDEMED